MVDDFENRMDSISAINTTLTDLKMLLNGQVNDDLTRKMTVDDVRKTMSSLGRFLEDLSAQEEYEQRARRPSLTTITEEQQFQEQDSQFQDVELCSPADNETFEEQVQEEQQQVVEDDSQEVAVGDSKMKVSFVKEIDETEKERIQKKQDTEAIKKRKEEAFMRIYEILERGNYVFQLSESHDIYLAYLNIIEGKAASEEDFLNSLAFIIRACEKSNLQPTMRRTFRESYELFEYCKILKE